MSFRRYVWGNIIEAIKAVCEAADTFGLKSEVACKEAYELVMTAQAHEGEYHFAGSVELPRNRSIAVCLGSEFATALRSQRRLLLLLAR